MSHLIEQVKGYCKQSQRAKHVLVYYYCYFGHNQDEAAPFLRWLISQICRQSDCVPGTLRDMYKRGEEPSLTDLLGIVEDALEQIEVAYVIVDGIDESSPRQDLLEVFGDLVTDPRFHKIQLLTSSRDYIDIERVMERISVSVPLANTFVEHDIRLYVRSRLRSNPRFHRWPQDLLDEAENTISKDAKGMYVTL